MSVPRNVVLLTVDCLRADHLPFYGYERETAPFLSTIAEESVLFENAYATGPGTSVSFPSILTSTYPFEFGGYGELSDERTSIAEVVPGRTIGIHSNTYLSREFGYQRGFDVYESFYERSGWLVRLEKAVTNRIDRDALSFKVVKSVYERLLGGGSSSEGRSLPYERADSTTDVAINHLEESSSPFFLWTHFMDVHAPHSPPNRHFETFGEENPDWQNHHKEWTAAKQSPDEVSDAMKQQFVDAYDAEIRFVDEQIERLFQGMRAAGHHEDTLYLITADHGELLGEHGSYSHPPRLYDELLHVPLLAHYPGADGGGREEGLVSLVDVPATVADVFDAPMPESYRGRSLLPTFEGAFEGREFALSELCHTPEEGFSSGTYDREKALVACRTLDATYLKDWQRGTEEVRPSDLPPEGGTDFRTIVEDHLTEIETTGAEGGEVEIADETAERLRELGYVE